MQELLRDDPSERDWHRIRPVLDDAMDELSEKDRLAVLLRFFENRVLNLSLELRSAILTGKIEESYYLHCVGSAALPWWSTEEVA